MFACVHIQRSSSSTSISKNYAKLGPAANVAGLSFFYFFVNALNKTIETSALTTDATITASTAIS